MGRKINILEGFLTSECPNCPNWCDTQDCWGCGKAGPIVECPAFARERCNDEES